MKEFLKQFEAILIDLWNYLYRFLCNILGEEANEDWLVNPFGGQY